MTVPYVNIGALPSAREVFDKIVEKSNGTWTIPDAPNNRTITFSPGPGKRLVPTPGKPGLFEIVDDVTEERTLAPLPLAKPRELAAGQVWEIEWSALGLRRYTLTVPHSGSASAWCYEENGNSWIDERALLSGEFESPACYLGTREEVAAREQAAETGKRAAEQLRHGSPPVRADLTACASAILAQLPPGTAAVEIERTDSDGVFLVSAHGCSAADVKRAIVATPGLPVVLTFLAKPTPGRADHPREVKGLVYGYGPDPIGRLDGFWIDISFSTLPRPELYGSAPPPWTVADARREIDRVLAAEARRGAPFLRAKRAALATLAGDDGPTGHRFADSAEMIRGALAALDAYEKARPGMREMTAQQRGAAWCAADDATLLVCGAMFNRMIYRYEQERAR